MYVLPDPRYQLEERDLTSLAAGGCWRRAEFRSKCRAISSPRTGRMRGGLGRMHRLGPALAVPRFGSPTPRKNTARSANGCLFPRSKWRSWMSRASQCRPERSANSSYGRRQFHPASGALPGKTSRDFRDGWFYTGDLARLDSDGYYFLVERKDDLIITAGYNVYPRESGGSALHHAAGLRGGGDRGAGPTQGEIVKAFVVLREGAAATSDSVVDFCRERLANFKVPRDVEFIPELPKLPNGKILRRALRDRAKGARPAATASGR